MLIDFHRKMLEFRVNNDGFSEPEITDRPHIGLEPIKPWTLSLNDIDIHGSAPLILVPENDNIAVFDLRTRGLYRLPPPKFCGDLAVCRCLSFKIHILIYTLQNVFQIYPTLPQYVYRRSPKVILTKTHVITIQMHVDGQLPDVFSLIQAFAGPDSAKHHNRTEVGELYLTHHVVLRTPPQSFGLLRDSIVDPVTGSVNIRLLHITWGAAQTNFSRAYYMSCLDLTLPDPGSTTNILPISVHSQKLLESISSLEPYTACGDGYVRGLLLINSESPQRDVGHVRKFTIDASGEECIMKCSDPYPLYLRTNDIIFDGMRGFIHYTRLDISGELPDTQYVVTAKLA